MSKYWGVGEEDEYIPPTSAEIIPKMRLENKSAKVKCDTEYNGRACRRSGKGDRRGTSVKQKVRSICISLHAKSTGSGLNLIRKCKFNWIK